jgi:hypothetical protein
MKYKSYKNKLIHIIRIAKKKYYSEQIENCKSNIKQTWDVIKDLLSKNKCKSSYPESFKKENTTISKEDEIAKEFNNFFSNIGQNLAKKFNKNNTRNYTKYLKSNYPKSLFLTRNKRVNSIKS